MKKILILIPVYNDWDSLKKLINEINKNISDLTEKILKISKDEKLRKRMIAAGFTMEELELILHPMVSDAKESTGSMGDDTPVAVLSDKYRPLSHFFRQKFSQVTNPPIDSLREQSRMSLKTRFGNLQDILSPNPYEENVFVIDSPFITNGLFKKISARGQESTTVIDCTVHKDNFNLKEGKDLGQKLKKLENIWMENNFQISNKQIVDNISD